MRWILHDKLVSAYITNYLHLCDSNISMLYDHNTYVQIYCQHAHLLNKSIWKISLPSICMRLMDYLHNILFNQIVYSTPHTFVQQLKYIPNIMLTVCTLICLVVAWLRSVLPMSFRINSNQWNKKQHRFIVNHNLWIQHITNNAICQLRSSALASPVFYATFP